jgi:branched-chain amino acid transport system substrate-binding protein
MMSLKFPFASASFRRSAVVPAAVSLVLLAACGSDGDDGGGSDSAAAAAAELKGSPIVIGAMIDQSSPTSSTDAPTADVVTAWAAHVNENGGIGGHPVEVQIEDTRADASQATSIAQDFIDDPKVVAVLSSSSGSEGATGELFGAADLPVTGVGYNPRVWSALPNFYTVTTTVPTVVSAQVASAADVGAKTMATVNCSENANCTGTTPIIQGAAQALEVTFAGALQVSASAPNYTAECLKIVDEKADYVQLSVSAETSGRLVTDCQRQGYEGWFGATAGSVTPGLYDEVSDVQLAGAVNGFPWWVDSAPVEEFRAAMEEQGVEESTYGNPHATGMWAAAELLRKALSGVTEDADVTRATVTEGYGTIQGETLDGLLPQETTYTPGQPAPAVTCFWLYTYEDGEFSGGDEPTCAGS